jgi:hypothetical protein
MVNTADNLYNSNLTLGSYSSGKENLPPKRLVRPSKYQCSPFDNDLRGPLTPLEKQLHSNIVALSKIEPDRRAVLVDKTSLSLGQLGNSFDTNGHVEAYVFNVFCRLLFRDNHPRQSKKHYFFTTIAVSTISGQLKRFFNSKHFSEVINFVRTTINALFLCGSLTFLIVFCLKIGLFSSSMDY